MMPLPQWRDAIAGIESAGSGDYAALGPFSRRGDRPYGRYQVMGSNIPSWTKEALGRSMTPDEFLNDKDAQDSVFDKRFGQYAAKYGPQGAASMWFSGQPNGGATRDSLGTSVDDYMTRFARSMGGGSPAENAIQAQMKPQAGQPLSLIPGAAQAQQADDTSSPDWGGMLMGVGAGLQSIDNPRGAAVTAQLLSQERKSNKPTYQMHYDPKTGTVLRMDNKGNIVPIKNPNWEEPDVKVPESALKNAGESVDKYGTIAALNQDASNLYDDLQTGKLKLGLFNNWLNSGRNLAGISDEESRAFARWESFKQKLANDQLLQAKGVQTEGDAWRAMKEFSAGGGQYDNETAKESLKRVIDKGQEAVLQRGRTTLDAHKAAYGDNPAFKPFIEQADRWKSIYDDINTRMQGYAKPATAPAAAPTFKVINVR